MVDNGNTRAIAKQHIVNHFVIDAVVLGVRFWDEHFAKSETSAWVSHPSPAISCEGVTIRVVREKNRKEQFGV
jgi:hypothetical protein